MSRFASLVAVRDFIALFAPTSATTPYPLGRGTLDGDTELPLAAVYRELRGEQGQGPGLEPHGQPQNLKT
jgi:hypothetical protein